MHLTEFKSTIFPLKSRLYRLARWMLLPREDAEDVVQEVFLKLWTMRTELHEYRSIEALAVRMTRNLCLNQLKARKNPFFTIETQTLMVPGMPTDEALARQDTADILYQLIARLPAQQRLMVQLRDVEGMEVDEIAQIADTTSNNVRVTLSLGRKRIREIYRHYYGDAGE
jgi:RNA polymerase sigma-70 factor (ECF subfamily)